MKRFILASASPRRKKILETLGLTFEIIQSDVDEKVDLENSPYEWVKAVSEKKAVAVSKMVTGEAVIIAADTIVTDMGKILNKPTDRNDAVRMLKMLQGKKHTVYTGITLVFKNDDGTEKMSTYVDATDVFMRSLTDKEINSYVDTEEPFDKAGAYAIQGKGSVLVESIAGDYFTVVGLPVYLLQRALSENGVNIMDCWNK